MVFVVVCAFCATHTHFSRQAAGGSYPLHCGAGLLHDCPVGDGVFRAALAAFAKHSAVAKHAKGVKMRFEHQRTPAYPSQKTHTYTHKRVSGCRRNRPRCHWLSRTRPQASNAADARIKGRDQDLQIFGPGAKFVHPRRASRRSPGAQTC